MRLRYEPDDVLVEVADNGRGAPAHGAVSGGSGIRGMQERARAVGGRLTAGPRAAGGFAVTARLPYGPAVSPAALDPDGAPPRP